MKKGITYGSWIIEFIKYRLHIFCSSVRKNMSQGIIYLKLTSEEPFISFWDILKFFKRQSWQFWGKTVLLRHSKQCPISFSVGNVRSAGNVSWPGDMAVDRQQKGRVDQTGDYGRLSFLKNRNEDMSGNLCLRIWCTFTSFVLTARNRADLGCCFVPVNFLPNRGELA